jgi:hypothetical protein
MLLSFLVRRLEGQITRKQSSGARHSDAGSNMLKKEAARRLFKNKTPRHPLDLLTQANRFSLEMVWPWFALLIPLKMDSARSRNPPPLCFCPDPVAIELSARGGELKEQPWQRLPSELWAIKSQ